jgi:TnpA family transposase
MQVTFGSQRDGGQKQPTFSNMNTPQTRRLTILNADEIEAIFGLPQFTEDERQVHFALSPIESEVVNAARTITAAVHLTLQIGYFKAKSQFYVFDLDMVSADLLHILGRHFPGRGMHEIGVLSKPTRLAQQGIVLKLFDFRLCDAYLKSDLISLAQRLAMLSTKPIFILREVLEHLANQHVVAPGYTFLQDLVSGAIMAEHRRITRKLDESLSPKLRRALDEMLHAGDKQHLIIVLEHEPKDFSNTQLREEVARRQQLAPLYDFTHKFLADAELSNESIKDYAALVQFYSLYKLRRIKASTARLYLLCFTFYRFRQINDNLIEAYIHLVNQFDKQTKFAAKEAMHKAVEEASANLQAAGQVLELFVNDTIAADCPFCEVQERAFGLLAPTVIPSVANYLRNVAFDRIAYEWDHFAKLSRTVKRNLRHLFCELDFSGRVQDAPLINAIAVLQTQLRQHKSLRQIDPLIFPTGLIPPSIKRYLYVNADRPDAKGQSLDVDRYEFLVYRLLRNALESGDLYVNNSNEFRQFEDDLISEVRWSQKEAVLDEIGVPLLQTPIEETLATMRIALESRFASVNQRVTECVNEHIKVSGQGDKKRWSLVYPADQEQSVNSPFYSQLPGIGIADLLRFVGRTTGFMNEFTHVLDRSVKSAPDTRQILACMVAFGTNMGLGKMAEVSGLVHSSLATTARSYIRPETLRDANDAISNATAALPAFDLFNIRDTLHSSSDGQRFETQIDTYNARYSPKYFGLNKGVSACTLVANHVPINVRVIGTHEHESHYVFDLLYNNSSDIQPTRHSTDTHGTNQVNFWILHAFGYGFAPRYKRLQRKTASLVGFEYPSKYPADMLIRPSNKVNEELIISEWPNVQRIMASLAQKDTTQATIVRKLSSYARQNQTKKALWELDNICRSIYILDFIDDVELRQSVQKALNRGEAYHRFRRAVSFINGGKFKVQTEVEQQIWNDCARLIANAVIYYNTALLSKVYEQKLKTGDRDAVEFIQGMSPVAWQHVNMFGSFEFSDEEPTVDLEELAARYADSEFWARATSSGQGDLFD